MGSQRIPMHRFLPDEIFKKGAQPICVDTVVFLSPFLADVEFAVGP